jgi:Cd2+/Zn2+-exporting ATPase
MDCAAEEAEIRRALEPIRSIESLGFQLAARTLTIAAPASDMPAVQHAIRSAGFDPQIVESTQPDQAARTSASPWHCPLFRPVVALALSAGAEGVSLLGGSSPLARYTDMGLAAVAVLLGGFDTYRKGIASLRHARLTITALMSVAVTGAFLIGQWPEAAMVMALYAIAEVIEARSLDRARNAIRGLMQLAPDTASVREASGAWLTRPASEVAVDAIVRVLPGQRIPLDGIVTKGTTAINEAPVTGESIPVDKSRGDPVFAGTINETAEFEFRVTAVASHTTLARIIQAVESAQGSRAPTQRFVDRFAGIYTPAIFVLAVAVAAASPWLLGWTWTQALYKALVLLVIGCPCALVISTPVTVVSALASAARRGILVKGGAYLEDARRIRVLALDKTGTITEGKPALIAHDTLSGDSDEMVRDAAALAARSDHPVARAIASGLAPSDRVVTDFKALAGRGVAGTVNSRALFLGNHRLIEDMNLCSEALEARLRIQEEQGRTVTLLASAQQVLGLFVVADTIKASSREAVAELRALGVRTVMLTGDNQSTATRVAQDAGIEEARGHLLPEDKLQAIRDLKGNGELVAMTGDGINDAPALALADIGIAMGAAGTDAAIEAADVVVMNDDLRRIPEVIRLSQRTRAILLQNITLALGIKAGFLALALFNGATMWMAVFADMGASLIVVANGLRLLRSTTLGTQ